MMMNDDSPERLPDGLTEEAREERLRFLKSYEQLLESAKEVSLSVLVWGQSPERNTAASKKREEIRDELRRLGHNAMFSEEIRSSVDNTSEKSKEFAQALAAHSIIILVEDSPGASAEAQDFCNDPRIAPKILVMIPERYRDGYSAKGAIKDLDDAFGGVFFYGDADLTRCKVLDKAVNRVEALRNIVHRARS